MYKKRMIRIYADKVGFKQHLTYHRNAKKHVFTYGDGDIVVSENQSGVYASQFSFGCHFLCFLFDNFRASRQTGLSSAENKHSSLF